MSRGERWRGAGAEPLDGDARGGAAVHSRSIKVNIAEGDLGGPLGEIQSRHGVVSIGSYPFETGAGYGANIVLRSRDNEKLDQAEDKVRRMLDALSAAQGS